MTTDQADVVVLLGSRFSDLATMGTRWAAVLQAWREDPRVGRLDVFDYPRFGRPQVVSQPSWIDGVGSWSLRVAGRRASSPLDGLGWRATGLQARRALGRSPRRVAVAATPLTVPLLAHLRADRTGFDAVDDWRHRVPVKEVARRIRDGYRGAASCSAVTAVSTVLADRLRDDLGLDVVAVPNGVHLGQYASAGAGAALPELPSEPFAVYLGYLCERVDLDLLEAAADVLPVVVAGPVEEHLRPRLEGGALRHVGVLPKADVPALLSRASVGLLLHHVNELTRSMDPMKQLEYEAAGLRVVATDLPGVAGRPGVTVVGSAAEVHQAVRTAAGSGRLAPPSDLAERDWSAVAARLLSVHLGEAS